MVNEHEHKSIDVEIRDDIRAIREILETEQNRAGYLRQMQTSDTTKTVHVAFERRATGYVTAVYEAWKAATNDEREVIAIMIEQLANRMEGI